MKIESLKDLKRLVQLCRKMGIDTIEVSDLKISLGPTPVIYKYTKASKKEITAQPLTPDGITEDTTIQTDGLTYEQQLFYSAQPNSIEEQQPV